MDKCRQDVSSTTTVQPLINNDEFHIIVHKTFFLKKKKINVVYRMDQEVTSQFLTKYPNATAFSM